MLSVALAATVRVPEIVAPAVGVMMEAAGGVMSVNVAVTVVAALRVTVQAPGAAVSVTAVPLAKLAAQVAPQVIPPGELVTVPLPVPALLTVSAKLGRLNVAVTVVAALKVTVQAPVPEQPPPLQPVKIEPATGAAVRVTGVPVANAAEHVTPQEMAVGALVTVPLPAPVLLTVSVKV